MKVPKPFTLKCNPFDPPEKYLEDCLTAIQALRKAAKTESDVVFEAWLDVNTSYISIGFWPADPDVPMEVVDGADRINQEMLQGLGILPLYLLGIVVYKMSNSHPDTLKHFWEVFKKEADHGSAT